VRVTKLTVDTPVTFSTVSEIDIKKLLSTFRSDLPPDLPKAISKWGKGKRYSTSLERRYPVFHVLNLS
jgi:hypothetical protein